MGEFGGVGRKVRRGRGRLKVKGRKKGVKGD
jgi:hypothetical protein